MAGAQAWLVVNPTAGGGRAVRHAELAAQALAASGIAHRVVRPASAAVAQSSVREAVASGARAVVACGGDGTVHTVIQELVGTGVPLGIVAGGSGDDIAMALGFPHGDAAAGARHLTAALASGQVRHVDAGLAEASDGSRHHFAGVLSTGFDSAVNERANAMARLGGQRYTAAMVRELASFRPVRYRLTVDGRPIEGEAMLVAVGNGPSYGRGMRICPAAVPDDGLLDITWLSAVSKVTFLRLFPSVYKGEHVRQPYVRTFRGARLRIEAAGQVAYADGERVGPLPVDVHLQPGALAVVGSA
ncbi:MAG: diacylglycerol/lipid kinase family protein [Candidatus Nanopelagicales bacterium]